MRAIRFGSTSRLALLAVLAGCVALLLGAERAQSAGVVRTWTGNGANSNWTTAANWNPGLPQEDDLLVFPAVANRKTNTNDFPDFTIFKEIRVEGGGYALGGNRVTLTDGFRQDSTGINQVHFGIGGNGPVRLLNGRLELHAENFYTGGTIITGGELYAADGGALGSFMSKLDVYGGTATIAAPGSYLNPIDIGGATASIAVVTDVSWFGDVQLFGHAEISVQAGFTFELDGVVSGGGTPVKAGGGTLRLSDANTFAGVLEVLQGVVVAAHDAALGSPADGTVVHPGAALGLDDTVAIDDEPIEVSGTLWGISGIHHVGNLTMGDGAEFLFDQGIIRLTNGLKQLAPGGTVTVRGSGLVELEGTGNFTGTVEVAEGTLAVRQPFLGSVTIAGGTLEGDSQLGPVDGVSGILRPGILGTGTLTVDGALTLAQEMEVEFRVDSAASFSKLRVHGAVTLDQPILWIDGAANVPQGTSLTLIENLSAAPLAGEFFLRPQGSSQVVGATSFELTYAGGPAPANDFVMTANQQGGGAGVDIGVMIDGAGAAAPASVYPFTVQVSNLSNTPAGAMLAQVIIPQGAAFVSSGSTICSFISAVAQGTRYDCAVPAIPALGGYSITVTAAITAQQGTNLVFRASVTPKAGDPPGNNSAEKPVNVSQGGLYRLGLPAVASDGTW